MFTGRSQCEDPVRLRERARRYVAVLADWASLSAAAVPRNWAIIAGLHEQVDAVVAQFVGHGVQRWSIFLAVLLGAKHAATYDGPCKGCLALLLVNLNGPAL